MSEKPQSTDELTRSVVNVVDAAFGVGVALAKTAARVTAMDRAVPEPANDAAIPAIIHYSLATATNLVSLVTSALTTAGRDAGAAVRTATAAATRTGPTVRAGGTLRVPLSVENPGDRPMTGMAPLVRSIHKDGAPTDALGSDGVRFTPAAFEVAPRDFEKLTVFITVPETAAPGRYDLVLALSPDGEDLPIRVEVVAPEA